MFSPHYFLLLMFPAILHGFTLDEDNEIVLKPPGLSANSLLGWSMAHYNQDMILGAPLESGNGSVFRCTNLNQGQPRCSKEQTGEQTGGWYGSSVQASSSTIFVCGHRVSYKTYISTSMYMGKCYTIDNSNRETDLINFQSQRSFDSSSSDRFYDNGVYGVSISLTHDERLVVGSPTTFDKIGYDQLGVNGRYIVTGSIGRVTAANNGKRATLQKAVDQVKWVTSDIDRSNMVNTFKFVGVSMTRGIFFKGGRLTFAMGAPKDSNYRGAVYVCKSCFLGSLVQPPAVEGEQLGESFGSALAACDINRDGLDDLIVGAPTFANRRTNLNTGKVYVLINNPTSQSFSRVSDILPDTDPQNLLNARFGSSVACLGAPDPSDTTDTATMLVVVGAPYYRSQGAIFVYRSRKDSNTLMGSTGLMSDPQIILSPAASSSRGFGMKLSNPDPGLDWSTRTSGTSWMADGIAVSSPETGEAWYYRTRPLIRINGDQSSFSAQPPTINFKEIPTTITVTASPKVEFLSSAQSTVMVTAIASYDSKRLSLETGPTQAVTVSTNTKLVFEFRPVQRNFGIDEQNIDTVPDKLSIGVTLSFTLPCRGAPCPMFDPLEADNQEISVKKSDDIEFNICEVANKCECDVQVNWFEKSEPLIAGEQTTMVLGQLNLTNIGTEPAVRNSLNISIDQSLYRLGSDLTERAGCEYESGQHQCKKLPILSRKGQNGDVQSFDLSVTARNPILPNMTSVNMTLTFKSICNGEETPPEKKNITVPVTHKWDLKAIQSNPNVSKEWYSSDEEKSYDISLRYSVTNTGPSLAPKGAKIYVFTNRNNINDFGIVQYKNVTLIGSTTTPCRIDTDRRQTPPQAPIADSSTKMFSCDNLGDCTVYECLLQEDMGDATAYIEIDFTFNKTFAVKKFVDEMEITKFWVVTALCASDSNQGERGICSGNPDNVVTTVSKMTYTPDDLLSALLGQTELIAGIAAALVVFIIIMVIACKCNLFNKVRIYKQDEEPLDPNNEEMENMNE